MANELTSKTMHAWAIHAYDKPLQFVELPIPEPGPNDLLIRMHGSEVGDWDEAVRRGEWDMERPFPLVLGLAGAGKVAALGERVHGFAEHDAVYVYDYPLYDQGAWAEYMRVPASAVAHAPARLDLTYAGGLPIAGLTAHDALLSVLRLHRGDVVLITAAAGGVGHLATQIAALAHAHVIATASARNHEFVRSLGAHDVIDYTKEDVIAVIRARFPAGVPKILNGISGPDADRLVSILSEGGHMVDLPGSVTARRPDARVDADYVVQGDGARLARVARMIDEEQLCVHIHETFPFARAPKALERVLTKHVRGKVVIKIA
jgi:NADPH:quinone reductase-like Zn-dependent oxidoreductase